MIENNQTFVNWVEELPEGDARFFRPSKTLRKDSSESKKIGEWVRWHVMVYMLGEIVRAEHRLGRDTTKTFEATDPVLEQFEDYVEEHDSNTDIKLASRWLSGGYTRAGESAFHVGEYERALVYYEREEAIHGRLEMHGPIYWVGILATLGRREEAIAKLNDLKGASVTSGQWRTSFERHSAFDPIRNDPEVIAIMDRWKRAEEAGKA